jgi:hypothetical protein
MNRDPVFTDVSKIFHRRGAGSGWPGLFTGSQEAYSKQVLAKQTREALKDYSVNLIFGNNDFNSSNNIP